ncbi:ribonuclease H [Paenibacillus sp. y28]|uniref:ribonuclease H n=1 Tax=Paenibacillus sp. y28 TaxID=3129110 RepID=UPI003018A963
MAKQKYYVVWVGRQPGVYTSWPECQRQVNQFEGAKFKAYESNVAAEQAFRAGWKGNWGQGQGQQPRTAAGQVSPAEAEAAEQIDYDSISVDVGTNGNPGPVEYKGVDTRTGEVIFEKSPISKGTNNLGEFLAIVHALSYLQKQGSTKTVYSDSLTAMKWVRQKAVSTTLPRDESTREIWDLVDRAENWLRTNTYKNQILKWQTQSWGEIKADYNRK